MNKSFAINSIKFMGFLRIKYRIFASKSALNRAMSLIEKFVINELSKAAFKAGKFFGPLKLQGTTPCPKN